jgi:hypothetical protein
LGKVDKTKTKCQKKLHFGFEDDSKNMFSFNVDCQLNRYMFIDKLRKLFLVEKCRKMHYQQKFYE